MNIKQTAYTHKWHIHVLFKNLRYSNTLISTWCFSKQSSSRSCTQWHSMQMMLPQI